MVWNERHSIKCLKIFKFFLKNSKFQLQLRYFDISHVYQLHVVRNDKNVNEHERLSNYKLRQKLK